MRFDGWKQTRTQASIGLTGGLVPEASRWGASLRAEFKKGFFVYLDACMQNSPLVMLNNTMDVAKWGAKISTRTRWASAKQNSDYNIHQAKGSHSLMPKLFDHGFTSIFQNTEQVHPLCSSARSDYTCIGITELEYQGEPGDVVIRSDEIAYPSEVFKSSFQPSSKPTGSFGILTTACSITDHWYDSGISDRSMHCAPAIHHRMN